MGGMTMVNIWELERYGWTVVKRVIPQHKVDLTRQAFEDWYHEATGGDYSKLIQTHGIIQYPEELSHVWWVNYIRNSSEVHDVFRQVHDVDCDTDMVTSFDRINFQPSPNEKGKKYMTHHKWWHVDQSRSNVDFEMVQGYVDIYGSQSKYHAGLRVVSRSHDSFEHLAKYFEDKGWDKKDWFKFTEEELDEALTLDWKGYVVDVKSEPGDLVLWDSRTIHMSRRNSAEPGEGIGANGRRLVIYTCAIPKQTLTQKAVLSRNKFMDNKWTSSHWPDCRARLPIGQLWGKKLDPKVRQVTIKGLSKYRVTGPSK